LSFQAQGQESFSIPLFDEASRFVLSKRNKGARIMDSATLHDKMKKIVKSGRPGRTKREN
jgi:hypothetical protein